MKTASTLFCAALLLTGTIGAASASDQPLSSVTVSAQAGTLTYGTGGTVTYTVTVTRRTDTSTSSTFSVTLSQTNTLPSGAKVVSFVPSRLDFASGDASKTSTLTISSGNSTPAGPTTIKVKAASGDNSVKGTGTLSVGAAPATVRANDKSKTYGDDNPALDAAVTGEVAGDPIHYTLATTAAKLSNVAGNPYAITVSLGSNPNYVVTAINGALNIQAKLATVSANAKTRTYGDPNPALDATVVGEVAGGEPVQYSLSTDATRLSSVLGGPYPINVTLASNSNYSVKVPAGSGMLTVLARPATVKANSKSKAYGDPIPALDANVTGGVAGGDAIQYSLSTTATPLSNVAGSPYAIDVTLGANPNYSVKVPADNGTLGVTPAFATVKANGKTKLYGDPNPALDATVTGEVPGGDPIQYSLSTAATQLSNVAGSPYPIDVTLGTNPNYSVKVPADNGMLAIQARPANVTANDKSKVYGALNPSLDATVTGEVAGGDAIQYSLSTTATQLSAVSGSPYPITVALGANPNYAVTANHGGLSIDQATAIVKANPKTKLYGDVNPPLDATVTGEVAGGDPIQYSLSTGATQFSAVAGNPYSISITFGPNPNYSVSVAADNGALTIDARPATVKANDKTKTYGDLNPPLDAAVTGQVPGGDAIQYTLGTAATQLSTVLGGPYTIAVTLGANPNYSVTPTNGSLVVQPKSATVTANDKAKLYGAANPALDATVTGEVKGGESIHYTLATTATQFSNVVDSPFAITVTPGSNPNYSVTPTNGTLKVFARVASVTANNKTKTYGDANPPLDATVFNEVPGGDPIHYTLSTAAGQCSNVTGGPYAITVSLGSNPNYSVMPINGALTILVRPATVTANNKTRSYGDDNPTFDATVTGEAAGCEPVHFTLSTAATRCSNVLDGPFAIVVALGANPNYDVTPHNGSLAVQARFATVKANSKTRSYGDENPVLDATVTGEAAGCEPIHFTLSTAATRCSNVADGPFAILVTLGANPNYSVKVPADNGVLTVQPRLATVKANGKTRSYGDDNPTLDATVTGEAVGCEPIHFTLSTLATRCSNVADGPFPILVTLGLNPNYSVKVPPDNGVLTIEPRFATVKANCKTRFFGDDNPVLDAAVTGEAVGCEPIHYTLSTAATRCSNVLEGPYAILVTLGSNPNYSVKVPADNCVLTVVPRPATVKANNKTKTYGDENPALDATVTGEAAGCEPIHYTLSTAATRCSNVPGGPYAILVTLGSNPNYSVKVPADNGVLTIEPRLATVKANCKTKTYGDPNPALDATVTGEAVGCEPIHYTLSTSATQCSNVLGSPYPILVTLGSNPNYSVKVPADNCALTIEPRLATIKANPKTKTYGDPNPVLDATVTGEAPGCEPVHYTLGTAATQCSAVAGSPYEITVTLGSNPNYSVKVLPDNGKLTVEVRLATIKANCKTKFYGDPNPPLDATVSNEATGCEPVHYTLSTAAAQCSDVAGSPYPILVTLGSNPNYSVKVLPDNCALTIQPRLATVKANPKTKTYGDPNPPLDATVTNEAVGCEPVHYTLSTAATLCSSVAGGPYEITVTLGSNPNYSVKVPPDNGVLTVLPRLATVTANDKRKTYGDPNPALDATVANEATGCEPVHYTLGTVAQLCSNVVGSPYAIAVTLGANPNYTVTPVDGKLTIEVRVATVKANPKTKIYGDPIPTLDATVTGEAAGCEPVHYTLGTAATQCSDVAGGPYDITVTLGSNPNYSVKVPSDNGRLTILPRPVTVTANNKTKTYGDPNPSFDATVTGGVISDDSRLAGPRTQGAGCEPVHYTASTTATQCSNVSGSPYPITLTPGDNPNYIVTPINGGLTILARPATVTANDKTRVYGDPNPPLDATVTNEAVGCEPVHYTLGTKAVLCSEVVGSPYQITVTLGANPNYSVTPINGALSIACRPATVTANKKTKVYGDPNPPLDATVTGEAPGCEPIHYTLTTSALQCNDVTGGPYPIMITLGANPNYCITPSIGGLTILPRPVTITIGNRTRTYGDPNPTFDAAVTGEVSHDDAIDRRLLGPRTQGLGCEPVHYTLTTTATQCSDVNGSPYPITADVVPNPNYDVHVIPGTLNILRRPATVTAKDKARTYGDDNPPLDATVVGEAAVCEPIHYTLNTKATRCSDVVGGPYEITVLPGSNPNYDVTVFPGALTIERRNATVTVHDASKIYGDDDPPPDVAVQGEVAGCEPVRFTRVATVGCLDVGTYPLTVVAGSNSNYNVQVIAGTLTVLQRSATVTANNKTRAYGDENPHLDALVTNEATGCAPVHYTVSTTAVRCSDVAGLYPINVELGSNPNYLVTPNNGALTIQPRLATVTANAKAKFFGDAIPALDAIADGQVAGCEPIHYKLTTNATDGSAVAGSPYAINVELGANPNYDVTPVNASLTVTRAQATAALTFSPNPQQYSDVVRFTAAVPNGFLSGVQALSGVTVQVGANTLGTIPLAPSGSSLTGSLDVALLQAPGPYAVAGLLGSVDPNYVVTGPAGSTLTVAPEDARVKYTGATVASVASGTTSVTTGESSAQSSGTSNKATITLSATIKDISATADAAGDATFGDIRNAMVTFVDRGNGNAPIATVPVGLVSGDTKTGTATYNWIVDIGAATTKQFTVGVVVGNYYTRNSSSDNSVITVCPPNGNFFTVGGGGLRRIVLASSCGIYSADPGSTCDIDIGKLENRSGSPNGTLRTTVVRGGRSYTLTSGALSSLVLQPTAQGGTATFTGKVSLQDGSGAVIDNDAQLLVTMGDMGEPGRSDWVAISVWNKKGGLWFASNWDGSSTIQTTLGSGAGNLQFHGGGGALMTRATPTSPDASQPTPTPMIDIPAQYALSQNFPNPFTASTSLRFDLPELSRVTLTIYDVSGREVERLVDGVIDPGRHVATWSGRNRAGRPAEAGLYFVRMIATSQTGTGGLRTDRRVALVR